MDTDQAIDELKGSQESFGFWTRRRRFLKFHWGTLPTTELNCLSYCYTNVLTYGCTYSDHRIQRLTQMVKEMVEQLKKDELKVAKAIRRVWAERMIEIEAGKENRYRPPLQKYLKECRVPQIKELIKSDGTCSKNVESLMQDSAVKDIGPEVVVLQEEILEPQVAPVVMIVHPVETVDEPCLSLFNVSQLDGNDSQRALGELKSEDLVNNNMIVKEKVDNKEKKVKGGIGHQSKRVSESSVRVVDNKAKSRSKPNDCSKSTLTTLQEVAHKVQAYQTKTKHEAPQVGMSSQSKQINVKKSTTSGVESSKLKTLRDVTDRGHGKSTPTKPGAKGYNNRDRNNNNPKRTNSQGSENQAKKPAQNSSGDRNSAKVNIGQEGEIGKLKNISQKIAKNYAESGTMNYKSSRQKQSENPRENTKKRGNSSVTNVKQRQPNSSQSSITSVKGREQELNTNYRKTSTSKLSKREDMPRPTAHYGKQSACGDQKQQGKGGVSSASLAISKLRDVKDQFVKLVKGRVIGEEKPKTVVKIPKPPPHQDYRDSTEFFQMPPKEAHFEILSSSSDGSLGSWESIYSGDEEVISDGRYNTIGKVPSPSVSAYRNRVSEELEMYENYSKQMEKDRGRKSAIPTYTELLRRYYLKKEREEKMTSKTQHSLMAVSKSIISDVPDTEKMPKSNGISESVSQKGKLSCSKGVPPSAEFDPLGNEPVLERRQQIRKHSNILKDQCARVIPNKRPKSEILSRDGAASFKDYKVGASNQNKGSRRKSDSDTVKSDSGYKDSPTPCKSRTFINSSKRTLGSASPDVNNNSYYGGSVGKDKADNSRSGSYGHRKTKAGYSEKKSTKLMKDPLGLMKDPLGLNKMMQASPSGERVVGKKSTKEAGDLKFGRAHLGRGVTVEYVCMQDRQ